jgi:predicted RNase H-like HicB family nuclease
VHDGGDYRYMATSPDLPNLLVIGDTTEEVLTLAPQVASALIASMKAVGDALPETL